MGGWDSRIAATSSTVGHGVPSYLDKEHVFLSTVDDVRRSGQDSFPSRRRGLTHRPLRPYEGVGRSRPQLPGATPGSRLLTGDPPNFPEGCVSQNHFELHQLKCAKHLSKGASSSAHFNRYNPWSIGYHPDATTEYLIVTQVCIPHKGESEIQHSTIFYITSIRGVNYIRVLKIVD